MDDNTVSSCIAKFSTKFFNELDKTKSVVSSPLSAKILLGLLTLGTEREAHKELLTSLGIPDDDAIRSSFALVSSKLKSIQGVTLDVANKVYIKEGNYDLHPQLKEDAVKIFDAGFEKIDFNNGAKAADTINKWVESKTNERIKELLSADCLDSSTRVVLVNAIYFKGTWENPFDVRDTMDRNFHIGILKSIKVPMMYKEDQYMYGESKALGSQLLQIFYKGKEASMLFVLPRGKTGLNDVLKKLAAGYDLLAELDNIYQTKVQVTIPKFKIETSIPLNQLLANLGIVSIFNESNSGLTKILNNNEPLVVSKAIQKAFIEINEEGAEAAAATALMMCGTSFRMEPPVPRFVAEHPFLVAILVGNTVCFLATYRGE